MELIVNCSVVFLLGAATIGSLLLFWNESSLTEQWRKGFTPADAEPIVIKLVDSDSGWTQEKTKVPGGTEVPPGRLSRLLTELASCPICQSYHLAYLVLLFVAGLVPTEMLPENRLWLAAWWLPLQAAGLAVYRRI